MVRDCGGRLVAAHTNGVLVEDQLAPTPMSGVIAPIPGGPALGVREGVAGPGVLPAQAAPVGAVLATYVDTGGQGADGHGG